MTVLIHVSVNGDHKVPVKVRRAGVEETTQWISGRGAPDGKQELAIGGPGTGETVVVEVGPEEEDKG